MPPRPSLFLRQFAPPAPRAPWICGACFRRTNPPQRLQTSPFHASTPRFSEATPNHYETLQLSTTASAADIKRQFYTLSKKHHPDRNPDDPTASTRFVAISEAYHVLSVPEKRVQYDAQLQQTQSQSRWSSSGSGSYPQGSYSSASFGSRPASGLNKKRSTFRGPPPSFYKSGGYGRHSAKRQEHAYQSTQGAGEEKEAEQESYGDFGGFGPGQQKHGHEVPHFDDRRHKETHDHINEHIYARRRKAQSRVRVEEDYERGNMLVNFVLVSGVIGLVGLTAKVFGDRNEQRHNERRGEA